MKYLLVVLIAAGLAVSLYGIRTSAEPSQQTKFLCWEYANRNHEMEIAPARWSYLKTIGNPNDPEFFYQSCIGHITGKPATKEYVK